MGLAQIALYCVAGALGHRYNQSGDEIFTDATTAKVATVETLPNQGGAIVKPGQVTYINGVPYYKVLTGYTDEGSASAKRKNRVGYIKKEDFDALNVSTVSIPANFAGLEAEMIPTRLMEQLFRIVEVVENEDYVEVTARHVWYDNLKNYTLWEADKDTAYSAAAVCRNVLTNAISTTVSNVATDCTDTKLGKELDYKEKNLVECFLDPDDGICAKFGLSLIRYNWDFYCLKNVGYDRGIVIENGKNLLGVERTDSIENLATRVAPYGKDASGNIVWLDNNGVKYVDSQYIGDYSVPLVELYDTGLKIGDGDITAANIQDKLLEAGQNRFTVDKIDLPEVEMKIEFLSLGDTEEYAQYRGLDKVYLYDILTVKDTVRGYNYTAQVVGVEHDILTGMLTSVTIGNLNNWDGTRKIATWQVPEVDGTNIRLLSIQAGSFAPGAIQSADMGDAIINYAHFASATIDALTSDSIEAVTAHIHEIIAGSITADDITAGSITAQVLAAGAVTADKIDANAVTAAKIAAGAITTEKLDAYAVTAQKLAAEAVTADKIAAGAITASKIDATDISAINATLGTANIADARIALADIDYAHIKDLAAETAIFSTTITDQGVADRLYINRLLITYGQMVEATIGDLVIGASDGYYYHVDVEWDDDGVPTLVPTQVDTPSAEEIAAGHTSDGQTIIGNIGTFAELSSEEFYAINAIIDRITAKRIDVDELWARQAFISKLMAQDISSNTYIQATIGNWQSGSTITQTIASISSRISELGYGTIYYSATEPSHSNLVEGDIWVQPLDDHTWNDYTDSEWQEIVDGGSWGSVLGAYKVYTWTGQYFKLLFDSTVNTEMWTAIEQNTAAIALKANQTDVNLLSGEVSEFAATLEVQAEEITAAVSAVNAKVASYVMWADPTTAYTISLGDIWIKCQEDFGRWQETKESTWQHLNDTYVWGNALGGETYVWNGTEWILTSDRAAEVYQQTLIDQTSTSISLLAQTTAEIGDDVYKLYAELKVSNDRISAEVYRATTAEGGKIDKTSQYQTADAIVTEAVSQSATSAAGSYIAKTSTLQTATAIVNEAVSQAASAASGSYIAKTTSYQTADAIVTEAVRQASANAANGYIAKTTTYQTASSIVTEAVRQAGVSAGNTYIAKTNVYQTADAIVATAEAYTDNNAYKIQSGITINASGIEISGSKYVKIKSGGSFSVDSGKFSIDTSGNVSVNGTITSITGSIGGFNLAANSLSSGVNATYVNINSNSSNTYAIWAGAELSTNAPFRLKRDGTVYLTSLIAVGEDGTETTVNLRTANLWKLDYRTIKSYTVSDGYCTQMNLTGNVTLNFRSAASLTLYGSWSGDTFTVSNSLNQQTVSTTVAFDRTASYVNTALAIGDRSITLNVVDSARSKTPLSISLSGNLAYMAGWNAYRDQLLSDLGNQTTYYKPGTWRGYLWSAPNDHGTQYSNCASDLTAKTIPAAMT